jgi:elongator complex protein 3
LKIYPTLVIEGTPLYEIYTRGEYRPYSTEECVELLAKVKEIVPKWVRISRIQRDIPAQHIAAGSKRSDLRNLVLSKFAEKGERCRCIRCREVGRAMNERTHGEPDLLVEEYSSSGGREAFISIESEDALYGFVRLRFPSPKAHRPEIKGRAIAIIREIRVLGHSVPIGKRVDGRSQHTGLGMKLMEAAEGLAKDRGCNHLLVMSGIGARGYFRKLGYALAGPYMSREI